MEETRMLNMNDVPSQMFNTPGNAGIIPQQMPGYMYPPSPVFQQTFLSRDVAVIVQRVTVGLVLGYYWDVISKAIYGDGEVVTPMNSFSRGPLPAVIVQSAYLKHLTKMFQENADVTVAQVETAYLDNVLDAMVGIQADLNEETVGKFVTTSGIDTGDLIGRLGEFKITVTQLLSCHFRPAISDAYAVSSVELDTPYMGKADTTLTVGGFLNEVTKELNKPRETPWYTEIVNASTEGLHRNFQHGMPLQPVISIFLLKVLNEYAGLDIEQGPKSS